ncbi:unnamed protein product, partial [Parnassius mnemosyne]
MQAGLLNLQQTQSKTTNIKTTDMLPLTVTDTISFQTETQFKVKEPEAHKLKEIFNLSSEIEVREKILDEQIMPYNEKHPKALKTNFTISDADYENIVITQPDVHIQDKTMVKKDSPKTSDVEESEEIVTKFIQAPGNREPIQIKTKRTILRKRKTETSDTFNEGDIVIEESLDEENRSEIHQEINHNVQIEEYEGDETHLNYNNDKSTVEMPEEQFEIPKLRSQVLIEEIEEENESEESSLKKDKDFNMKTTEKIKQSQIEVINEEVQSDNLPSDKEEAPKQERTEELPEVTTKEENQSREGKPKQKKMTKRVIKTKVGPKMETSEVSTTKQDDEQPVVTIHKAKETFDDTITPFDDLVEPHEAKVVEEEPEEVKIDQVQTETGEIKKAKTVKRVIKKRKESKQEVTEITTVEKEGEEPVTTVLVTEEEMPENVQALELPVETTIEELPSEEGKPKQKKITKRVIKKKVGPKLETTLIITTQQDDEQPVVTIHKTEETFDNTTTPFDDSVETHKAKVVEEEPEEVKIDQVQTATGEIKKVKTVKRVIKKRQGPKQEVTEITTVEKEGEEPVTTISVTEEAPSDKVETPEKVHTVELPVETTIEELPSEEGKPKQKKIIKRVIKNKVGPKLETTQIITTQQDDEQPVVTIHKTEETFDDTTTPFDDLVEPHKAKVVEEEPEEVKIDQVQTETGEIKKVKTVKRVIKKRQGPKQEVTEITTVEKEGEEPVTTVVVTEEKSSDKEAAPEKVQTVELPEETTIEELPSEKGKPKQKKITKRVIKKKVGPKLETTQIITTQQDDEQPVVTIHKTEETIDDTTTPFDALVKPHKAKVVEEEPEEVKIDQVQTDTGEIKKVKTVKRVIKKRQGPKQEVTEITTVEKEGEEPVTTVLVTEEASSDKEDAPEKVQTIELPEETTIEELPSEEGKPKQKKITKRVIKKKVGPKLETTQIITTHQDDAQPVVTIHKTEGIFDDTITPFDDIVETHKAKLVEEEPEEVKIDQVQTETGELKKVKTVKRVIKKRQGTKQEVTEITTVEKEGEEPVTTVSVTEEAPSDKVETPEKVHTVELPVETTIEELPSEEGKPKQRKITKRVIKKKVGPKLETTQIITTQQDDEQPVFTIHKTEETFDDTTTQFDDLVAPHKAIVVEEEPEEVKVDQVQTETGEIKKVKTVKRVIKKRQGPKQEVTEITMVEKEGEETVTTVLVTEEATSYKEEAPEKVQTVELPEETTIEELPSEKGKPKQKKITKRVIKKKVGPKLETTQIITTQQDDEQPVVTIHKTEEIFDDTTTPFDDLVEPHKAIVVEEEPEEVKVDQVQTETGEIKKVKTVKRVIKKRQGPKQEVTEITTVQKEGEEPVTTVLVTEEASSDKEEAPEKVHTVELPEETTIEELQSEEGKPKQKKITKRVIKKKVGPKLGTTEIITTQQDDEQPVVTIHRTKETFDDTTTPFDDFFEPHKAKVIEEEPEEVKVDQVQTETGEIKKVKTVKRVIKKRQGPKQEVTEITTVEKEGEEPVTTVVVTEEKSSDKEAAPEKVQTVELPEETTIEELPSEEGKPKQKKITKRIIKKKVGPKLETTQIITTQQDDEQPVVTLHKTEETFDDTTTPFVDLVEPHKAKVVEEEPEEVKVDQVQTETGEIKKVKTVKRVIKKRQGPKQEVTEITTVQKEGEEPVTTVLVTEEASSDKEEATEKVHTVELPEETTIEERPSEEGKLKQKKITKRVIKKKVGPKLETTQIITTQQDDEQPIVTIH